MPVSKPRTSETGEKLIDVPFKIIIDTREQIPYKFESLYANADQENARLIVPTIRATLTTGDYSLEGMTDQIALERKTKQDLYSSISQGRENFVNRLEKMKAFAFTAVVIEGSWDSILGDPPAHTRFKPKSLARTIQSFMIRYPTTHWLTMPDRSYAEAITYRLLERYFLLKQGEATPTD